MSSDFDRLGAGEALGVGELLAVVDDVDAEAGVGRHARQVPADVSGADDEERAATGAIGSM